MTECRWCGDDAHGSNVCPRVKEIEFADDGKTVRRVTFFERPSDPVQQPPPIWTYPTTRSRGY
jgi:hypothetical protein